MTTPPPQVTDAARAAGPGGSPDERRAAFSAGMRDLVPALPGMASWGLVTGVAMVQSGLPLQHALGMSVTAYAGSAQLAVLPMIAAGAPLGTIALTALMMNLRFVIYSAALKRSLEHVPFWRRLGLGYLIGDMGTVLYLRRVHREPDWAPRDAYFLGMSLLNWACWHVSSLVGIFAAAWIPRAWGLEFAGTLALLALLAPLCTKLPGLVGTVVATAVGLATASWPARAGLVLAVVAGVAAALLVEERAQRRDAGGAS
jgi:predicted branched-subunit amino acid permease